MTRWPLLLLLVPLLPITQARIDERRAGFPPEDEALYLWKGQEVKRMFPGFEDLAADIYWLRTVQYFGGQRLFSQTHRFELLYPLVDITTALDPRMEIAYRYGAIFLCEAPPVGAGRPREGIAILERGTQALPNSWRLRQDLGFFYFLFLGDAQKAAQTLMKAAALPGSAFWLKTLAAEILAEAGDRRTSRQMWQHMYDQAEEGILKANAAVWLQVLDALDAADRLSARVREFQVRTGRRPASLSELEALGLPKEPTADPSGVPYAYDPATGQVTVSPQSTLYRPLPSARRIP